MLTRRVALPLVALTALATMPVLVGAAPAGASSAVVTPTARGNDGGTDEGSAQDNCPTEGWTIPLELKGLACILLLPKPDQGGGGGGGGLGGLL